MGAHYASVSSDPEPVPTTPMAGEELERGFLLSAETSPPPSYIESALTAVQSAISAVRGKLQLENGPPHKEGYEAPKNLIGCQWLKMLIAVVVGGLLVLGAGHAFPGPPPPPSWAPWGMDSEAPPPAGVLGWIKGFFFGAATHPAPPFNDWDFLLDSDLCGENCGPPHGPPHGCHPHGPPHSGPHRRPPHKCHPHGPPHGGPHGHHRGPPHGFPPHGPPHGPFPPPPRFAWPLIENTTRLVAEAVEEFFGTKLPEAKTCNESLSSGVAAIVKSATDKVTAFAEEPTDSKIREAFANFTKDFPKLAGLSAIADAHVSPVQLAHLRSLASGACYNDSGKALPKLFAIEGAVDRFFLPAVFHALLPPPPFGPPGPPHRKRHHGPPHHGRPHGSPHGGKPHDGPPEEDENDDVSGDDVAVSGQDSWIDPRGLGTGPSENKECPKPPPMDPEVLKKCVATNLELSRAVVKKAAFQLCNGPKPPHVKKIVDQVCEFAEENKALVRTAVLLRLQPWKIAIAACLHPPPPHGPHGPHPPHGPGPHGTPHDEEENNEPPQDGADELDEDDDDVKVYAFPDVLEDAGLESGKP